jgi:hypothetical protein
MEFLLVVIVILLLLIILQLRKLVNRLMQNKLPLDFAPKKQTLMNLDVDAQYYTDIQYPVYGREVMYFTAQGLRSSTHQEFDLRFGSKEKEHLVSEVRKALFKRNYLMMLQANIDVINGKLSIEEARNKTRESLEINNSEILHLASAQIEYDLTNGISRKLEDYLNYELLLDERDKYSKKQ